MTEDPPRPIRTGPPPAGLVAFLLALTAVRLAVAAHAGLVDDEAYYRLWSLEPAAGYFDHAPMVAWWIAAGRAIAGEGSLGIRLFAPFAAFGGSLLLWRAVALAEGRTVATRAAVWFNAMLLIGAGSVLITPDAPSVFFWGATLWALAELVASRDPRWWLAVGVAAGLGLASKYSVLFLGAGIALWLVARHETRRWFAAWQLWVGAAIALALFAPVVAWNAEHQWVSFAKQFGRTVPQGFRPDTLGEFFGVQILLIGLPMVPFVALGIRRAFARGDAFSLLPVMTGLPFLAYLTVHALHGRVEGNWPAPLYPAFAWVAAAAAEGLAERRRPFLAGLARVVAPFGFGLAALLYLHVTTSLAPLPPNRDPTAQTRGWTDFAAALEARGREVGAVAFGGTNYALSAQLARQLGAERVAPFDERVRYVDLPVLDPMRVCGPILFVDREGRDTIAALGSHWRSVTPLGTLARTAGGSTIEAHPLTLLADPVDCAPPETPLR